MTDHLLRVVDAAVLDVVARTLTYAEYECIDCAAVRWAALDAGIVQCSICGFTVDLCQIRAARPGARPAGTVLVLPNLAL